MLQNDVELYSSDDIRLIERIELSHGTESETVTFKDEAQADFQRFIPKPPFRNISQQEFDIITTPTASGLKLSLINLPAEIFAPLLAMGLADINSMQDYYVFIQHKYYQAAIDFIREHVKRYSATGLDFETVGFSWGHPDNFGIAYDANLQCFLGLHVDFWDGLPIGNLQQARNRICINLGREARYLLVINLSMPKIQAFCASQGCVSEDIGELRIFFMQNFPDYPVMKIRIEPFEAYIAPTEAVIHDGCTLGQTGCDLRLTFMGHFQAD